MRNSAPLRTGVGLAVLAATLVGAVACSLATGRGDEPEKVRRLVARPAVSNLGMVASTSVEANEIGVQVLARGGNAVDAAVAIAVALGAVDPGDSGLGGTTFILVRLANGRAVAIDGSSPVPIRVSQPALQRLHDADHKYGPELAATPGSLAALELARSRYGTMSLRELVEPAIPLAEAGYRLSPFHRASVFKYLDDVRLSPSLASIVLDEKGDPLPSGSLIRWNGLARTLRRIADGGAAEFYQGTIAAEIEADMIRRRGFVRRQDLMLVRARELEPYRGSYRGLEVLAFPAPGAGGAVIESLNLLECFAPELLRTDSVERLQAMAEAFHIAIEDHRALMPDSNLPQPLVQPAYLDKSYAASRAKVITLGRPVPAEAFHPKQYRPELESQTVQVSVIDRDGNAVSLTQSLGRFFGNKVVADEMGFLYNIAHAGADPSNPDHLRPRCVLPQDGAPTIVVADGRPLLVLGSAGSSRIAGAIATVISNIVDRRMALAQAVAAPRVLWSEGDTTRGLLIEVLPPVSERDVRALQAMGYDEGFQARFPSAYLDLYRFGGLNAVYRDPATGRLTGVGDPRRMADARGL